MKGGESMSESTARSKNESRALVRAGKYKVGDVYCGNRKITGLGKIWVVRDEESVSYMGLREGDHVQYAYYVTTQEGV